jgi:diguanylate cyclase (GGDEF)-like protein/PAS domain S-box-containing protein
VLYANPSVEEITGYSESELINEGEGFLRHEADLATCDDICRQARAGDHFKQELVIHSKHGVTSEILLSMDTLRDEQGEIEYFVGILTDISVQKAAREQVEHMATHDVLTGLPNRMLFEKRLNQVVSKAIRNQTSGALFFLDLDRFKSINDTLGHSFGDRMMVEVDSRLQTVCHRADLVARFGGDEFVILMEQVESREHAEQIAERILSLFDQKIEQDNYQIKIATSVGIALFPNHGLDTEELIKQADVAMYEAKRAGRNQYKFFARQYLESAIAGLTMEQEMLNALECEEFFLEYQPQYTLCDESLCGFEALIRWQHPLHGRVSPGEFISVAESCGLIDQIGLWVFHQVCEKVVSWTQQQLPFGRLAFNLSQRQLMDSNLATVFIDIMQQTGAIEYAEKIEFEITESLIIKQIDIALNTIEQLKATGMKLAIDDFGTGHSSLVNLKRYPLDRLKIDRGFVIDIGKDQNDEAIIKASITLAQGFGLQVIAEGVENELQKDFLLEVGCDEVQGFLFNKPLPIEQTETLLQQIKREQVEK